MSENVCQHFRDYYKEFGLKTFELVHAFFSVSTTTDARRRKVKKKTVLSVKLHAMDSRFPFFSKVILTTMVKIKRNVFFFFDRFRRYHVCVCSVVVVARPCFPAFIAFTLGAKDPIYSIT